VTVVVASKFYGDVKLSFILRGIKTSCSFCDDLLYSAGNEVRFGGSQCLKLASCGFWRFAPGGSRNCWTDIAIRRELHVRRQQNLWRRQISWRPSHVKQEAVFLFRIVCDLCALDKLIDSENDCQSFTIKPDGLSVCHVILCLRRKYCKWISPSVELHLS
jgi:hypothetical protein